MLRLVLGLAVVAALAWGSMKFMRGRPAHKVAVPGIPEIQSMPSDPASAQQHIQNELKRIETQNRAAIDNQLKNLQGAR